MPYIYIRCKHIQIPINRRVLGVFWGHSGVYGGRGSKGGVWSGSGAGVMGSSVKGEENKILVATLAAKSSLFYKYTINHALVHIK
jgi:hypothetical protein